MANYALPQFNDPSATARYLGESVGTHYSAALRATKAYGRHLAAKHKALFSETIDGESLAEFWRELIKSEGVRVGSPRVLEGLSNTPSHYFFDFLGTAETVYRSRYGDVSPSARRQAGKTEHETCLAFLRGHSTDGRPDHFTVQNKVTTWMQLLRIRGQYRE